jgi:maltose alpha-D-glucosyltransferase/alpha-amylase
MRTGVRTPMQWSDEKNAGFSDASPEALYLPVDGAPDRPTVASQADDPESLLNRVRSLIGTRHTLKALEADAALEVLYAESGKLPFVYTRTKDGQKVMVALNPANYEVSVTLPDDVFEEAPKSLEIGEGSGIVKSGEGWLLTLGPVSGALYKAGD